MQLPVPDREARKALNDNFVAIKQEDEKDDARLNREIQDREAADAKEESDRIAADEAEAQERKNADAKEASDRTSGDYNLQKQINDAINRISSLEQRVTDTEVGISKLNDRCDKLENLIKLLDSQLNSGMPLDNWLDKAKEGEDFDDLINEIE